MTADGVPYTWDAAGNLRADGVYTYAYDPEQRLVGVTAPGLDWARATTRTACAAGRRQTASPPPISSICNRNSPPCCRPAIRVARPATSTGGGTARWRQTIASPGRTYRAGMTSTACAGDGRRRAGAGGQALRPLWGTLTGDGGQPYGYSGEWWDAGPELVYLRARYLRPELGLFTGRDPWPGDVRQPGTLNGYAYGLGNPLRFTDPSGQVAAVGPECGAQDFDTWLWTQGTLLLTELGGADDLEAMAQITEKAAVHQRDWDDVLPALSGVFLGVRSSGALTLLRAGLNPDKCAGLGHEPHDCPGNSCYFGDEGFHNDFQDEHNQPWHAWGYIAQTAVPGGGARAVAAAFGLGAVANVGHEIVQSVVRYDGGWGTSWQDFVLSEAAMAIGARITAGAITPAELGRVLRASFGPAGPGSGGRLQYLEGRYGPLAGWPPQ